MQNGNSENSIRELIEAARAEERAKLETQSVIDEINKRLVVIESFQRELARELNWLKGVVQATYNNVSTLIQLLAAGLYGDKAELAKLQTRIADAAFEVSPDKDISISAGGDVQVSADTVGRDKSEETKD